MIIGMVGLGRMGHALVLRLTQAGYDVLGYDPAPVTIEEDGFRRVSSLLEIADKAHIIWLMVPAGSIVDETIAQLSPSLQPGDSIIDGGNSYFKDSIRRHNLLAQQGINFFDCGTSGGPVGVETGFSLMIGGDVEPFRRIEEIFAAIAAPNGYGYVGPSGAGHYVKMVHNGIEYALLESYAEGFHVLKDGHYKNLDLAQISDIWNHGAVIRSWILELAYEIFIQDQDLTSISGFVAESGTGRWTAEEAHRHNIPVPLIEDALKIRAESRKTGGNYATKVVALLRNKFGEHPVKKIEQT